MMYRKLTGAFGPPVSSSTVWDLTESKFPFSKIVLTDEPICIHVSIDYHIESDKLQLDDNFTYEYPTLTVKTTSLERAMALLVMVINVNEDKLDEKTARSLKKNYLISANAKAKENYAILLDRKRDFNLKIATPN